MDNDYASLLLFSSSVSREIDRHGTKNIFMQQTVAPLIASILDSLSNGNLALPRQRRLIHIIILYIIFLFYSITCLTIKLYNVGFYYILNVTIFRYHIYFKVDKKIIEHVIII